MLVAFMAAANIRKGRDMKFSTLAGAAIVGATLGFMAPIAEAMPIGSPTGAAPIQATGAGDVVKVHGRHCRIRRGHRSRCRRIRRSVRRRHCHRRIGCHRHANRGGHRHRFGGYRRRPGIYLSF